MMLVAHHRRRGQPTTCEACGAVVARGDLYLTWQTWSRVHHRCVTCGVPPRSQVSISRLRGVYELLEDLVPRPQDPHPEVLLAIRYPELHLRLTRVRLAYLGRPSGRAHTPSARERQRRADALTAVLSDLEQVQLNLEQVQQFVTRALATLYQVDPLVVQAAKAPATRPKRCARCQRALAPDQARRVGRYYTCEDQCMPLPAAREALILRLRASGHSDRMIAGRLHLPWARVREVR